MNQASANVSLTRTFYRSLAILFLFLLMSFIFKNSLKPLPSLSLINILTHEKSADYLTLGLVIDLVGFIGVFIITHLIWAYVVTTSCYAFFQKYNNDNLRTQYWFVLCLCHINLALLANSYFYPTSLLSIYRLAPFNNLLLIYGVSSLIALVFFHGLYRQKKWTQCILYCALLGFTLTPIENQIKNFSPSIEDNPNIILIGLDALRPDHLTYNKKQKHNYLPNINKFVSQSLIYNKAYTPLPRTFVSWLSLLKGQYPNEHGGRFNLTSPSLVDRNIPIIRDLSQKGYVSTYAIDERRFNQIDKSYGFDNVVGPKIGFADQLTNRIADFPLINLLSQTQFGKYFLPFMFINRANGKIYDPIKFNNSAMSQLSHDQANLFAIHFCFLHWPYTSKNFININDTYWDGNYNHFMYLSLLEQLDQQFSHLINNLRSYGYLDNAVVYVFSDHGDGFMLKNNELKPAQQEFKELDVSSNSWGHGTNALDQSQANVLLSRTHFKHGKRVNNNETIDGNFSLIDIMPTIYQDIGLPPEKSFQGLVLPKTNVAELQKRVVFSNSSKPSKSLNTSFIKDDDVMYENLEYYYVNSKGHLTMTEQGYNDIKLTQHRSVYYNDKQLIHIPSYGGFIAANLNTNIWQPITEFAINSDWYLMLNRFCDHYLSTDKDLNFKACDSLN